MPVFKQDIEQGEAPVVPMVRCVVRREGRGKISTGHHDAKHGEQYYDEGEEITLPLDVAKELSAGDPPPNHAGRARYYVDILGPADDADIDAPRRGRPPKVA